MVRVKICGITNLPDALQACECGADALGFVFFTESPRSVGFEAAAGILRALPPFVTTVGVFVNPTRAEVGEALRAGVRVLQFHGDEESGFCGSFGVPYVKGFRVREAGCLSGLERYKDASALLLDAYSEKEYGGTGQTFNWDAAVYAKRAGRVILAGGLTPDNVASAVEHVQPYAVDVSSGVEAEKGIKDHDAVKRFIHAARHRRQDVT